MWLERITEVVKHIYPDASEIGLTGDPDNPISRILAQDKPLDIPSIKALQTVYAEMTATPTPEPEDKVAMLEAQLLSLQEELNLLQQAFVEQLLGVP